MSPPNHRTHYFSSDSDGGHESNSDSNIVKAKVRLFAFFTILSIAGSVALFIRLYHPSKPKFLLQDAAVFNFNLSAAPPHFLNSSIQLTLASQNPTQNGIYYTDMRIYALYKNQQITYKTTIPDLYQGHKGTNVWSLFINGVDIPIAPYNVDALSTDQSNRVINIIIIIDGKVWWKVIRLFNTRKYNFHVLCDVIMDFGSNAVTDNQDITLIPSGKYLLHRWCRVAV